MIPKFTHLARGFVCVTFMSMPLVIPAAAYADTAVTRAEAIAPSGFNWLANGKTLTAKELELLIEQQRLANVGAMGEGSWICSPAGFGRRSYCSRN